MKYKIYPLPKGLSRNKYLDILYDPIRADSSFEICEAILPRILLDIFSWQNQKVIIHLHWSTQLYGSAYLLKSILTLLLYGSILLFLQKVFNCKVCWTIHNEKSHDYPHPRMDRLGRKFAWWVADAVIVQQSVIKDKLSSEYPKKEIFFVPHPPYPGFSQRDCTNRSVRKRLGIPKEAVVFLSFGMVRPYKNIDKLIEIFKEADRENEESMCFVIAGKAVDGYTKVIKQLTEHAENILFINEFVDESDIPCYFDAADFTVFYYGESSLTSGALVHSLSYGVPVISRQFPGAEMIVEGKNGYLYSSDEELKKLLIQAGQLQSLPKKGIRNCLKDYCSEGSSIEDVFLRV